MITARKVAIYVRVSTAAQAEEGYSIEEQKDKLVTYCKIKDWHVHDIYIDGGFSGSNTYRPALDQLIKDAKAKRFDTVLVYKLDRLSRSQKDTLYLIEDVFVQNQIDFLSLQENFDTSTPFGKAMIGLLSVFAQLEREQIKERMMLGKLGRAKAGNSMMWVNPPFGYRIKKGEKVVTPDPIQAVIVKRLFSEYIAGKSISKILGDLDKEGHVGRDKPWSLTTIKNILQNPTYCGKVRYQGHIFEGLHQPIITEEEFEMAQFELKRRQEETYSRTNNRRPFQSKYMLSGLLVCGYCGSGLRVYVAHKRRDGSTPPLKYQCGNRYSMDPEKRCSSGQYSMADLEEAVLEKLLNLNLEPMDFEKPKTKIDIREIRNELKSIEIKMNRLMELYIDGIIDKNSLIERQSALERGKKALETALDETPKKIVNHRKKEIISQLNQLNTSIISYEDKMVLIRNILKSVVVSSESIEIVLDI